MSKLKKLQFNRIEQAALAEKLSHQFGYYMLLISNDSLDLVKSCQVRHHFLVRETVSPDTKDQDNTVLSSWYHLPFAPQSIDLVVLDHVLEYCASPSAILQQIQTILRPDGKLIITSYNPWRPYGYKLWRQRKKNHPDKSHAHMISPTELKYCLKKTSFEVINTHYYGAKLSKTSTQKKDSFVDHFILSYLPFLSGGYMIEAINRTKVLTQLPTSWKPYKITAKKNIIATPCEKPKLTVVEHTKA